MIRAFLLPRLADILSAAVFGRDPDRAIIDGLHALAQRQAEEIRATRDLLGTEGRGLPLEAGVRNVLGALEEARAIAQEQTAMVKLAGTAAATASAVAPTCRCGLHCGGICGVGAEPESAECCYCGKPQTSASHGVWNEDNSLFLPLCERCWSDDETTGYRVIMAKLATDRAKGAQ